MENNRFQNIVVISLETECRVATAEKWMIKQ